jgi:spore maturation protein CgeB
MRVLAVAEQPSWFDPHIVGSLIDMGHEVHRFASGVAVGEFFGRARQRDRAQRNRSLVELAAALVRGGGLDLIFCYVYDDFLTVESARALSSLGVPTVNLNVDMANQWYRQIRTAPYFTFMLCAQRANMASLARYGARVLHFPMAARPATPGEFASAAPVTFLGASVPYRQRILAALERAGVPLAVYGRSWGQDRGVEPNHTLERTLSDIYHYGWPRLMAEGPGSLITTLARRRLTRRRPREVEQGPALSPARTHGAVAEEEIAGLFRSSAINLGFTRIRGEDPFKAGVNQIKLRDFEVPMAGGFYLVEDAPDCQTFFVPDREVVTWRTLPQLVEKIRYYLDHDEERRMIAERGRRRALAEHTWNHRFKMLFDTLQID